MPRRPRARRPSSADTSDRPQDRDHRHAWNRDGAACRRVPTRHDSLRCAGGVLLGAAASPLSIVPELIVHRSAANEARGRDRMGADIRQVTKTIRGSQETMAISVQMPALGESVTEGTVTRWLKQEGDTVEVDEPLLEVSTDKVDTEIPSPAAGVLTKIVAHEDDTVEIGGELAEIGEAGEGGGAPPAEGKETEAGAEPKPEPGPEKKTEPAPEGQAQPG